MELGNLGFRDLWKSGTMEYKKNLSVSNKEKRGILKPLMSEGVKAAAKVEDLAYDFACRIMRYFQYLTEDADYKEFVISKQILRSRTTIGANRMR